MAEAPSEFDAYGIIVALAIDSDPWYLLHSRRHSCSTLIVAALDDAHAMLSLTGIALFGLYLTSHVANSVVSLIGG